MTDDELALEDISRCFAGAIPAVLCTASGDGTPNVTQISRVHLVDPERVALSNQFMSKTARNLAVNPRASVLLFDPTTHDEYRLSLVFERTDRRGPVFERLRSDIDAIAAFHGMQDVFRLRSADIFRVADIDRVPQNPAATPPGDGGHVRRPPPDVGALAELAAVVGRAGDLDVLVDASLEVLDHTFGYAHTHLLLADEEGKTLYTVASRGFSDDSIGAEVAVGDGLIGRAAQRCETISVGNLRQMERYARLVRRQFEDRVGVRPGLEVPVPGLDGAGSRLVVPAMSGGQLVGVLVVDSREAAAFTDLDEQALGVATSMLAGAIENTRALEREPDAASEPVPVPAQSGPTVPSSSTASDRAPSSAPSVMVRFFAVDGSTFLDHDYLIKGVAGRILWSLLNQHAADGRVDFTNREVRLDPTLEMPSFKDNFESRLLLLKRRLDERQAPIRIERTGRGRFRLHVDRSLKLDHEDAAT